MVLSVFLHMARVFDHGVDKPPREFNWVIGVILLTLTLLLSFTGYLLPWDQLSLWAVTVGTNMIGYTPVFGNQVKFVLLGGNEIGNETLAAMVRATRVDVPVHHRHLHGHPLLAGPQGRRDLRSAVIDGAGGLGVTPGRRCGRGVSDDRDPRAPEEASRSGPRQGGGREGRPDGGGRCPPPPAAAETPTDAAASPHPRPPPRAQPGREGRGRGGEAGRGRGRRGGGGRAPVRGHPSPRRRPVACRSAPDPAVTPNGSSPSSSPAPSRTSRPPRSTRSTPGPTSWPASSWPP